MWPPVIKRLLASATVAIVTAGYGVYRFREQQMDKLYAEAAGIPSAFRGVAEAQAAVRKLGAYRGDRSTVMLLIRWCDCARTNWRKIRSPVAYLYSEAAAGRRSGSSLMTGKAAGWRRNGSPKAVSYGGRKPRSRPNRWKPTRRIC